MLKQKRIFTAAVIRRSSKQHCLQKSQLLMFKIERKPLHVNDSYSTSNSPKFCRPLTLEEAPVLSIIGRTNGYSYFELPLQYARDRCSSTPTYGRDQALKRQAYRLKVLGFPYSMTALNSPE